MFRDPNPIEVSFLPENVTVWAHRGDTLLDAALDHGVDLPHTCGGNCSCTTCHVLVDAGAEHLSRMEEPEDERLDTAEGRTPHSRLACQALLLGGPVVIHIQGDTDEWTRALQRLRLPTDIVW